MTAEDCICAIDQGTQSTRVFLFDAKAQIFADEQKKITLLHPKGGWVEQDPKEILQTVEECLQTVLERVKKTGRTIKIRGVGIANQRETTLVWDKDTGRAYHNAIVWFDSRTSAICKKYREDKGSADFFKEKTGLPISTYFSAYKYCWLAKNVPEVKEAVSERRCCLGTMDTWLIWNLTGGATGGAFVTDVTNASRTNLMDIATQQWDGDLLEQFGVEEHMLAEIKSNAELYGRIRDGPLAGVPISGCLGDQQAALLGQSCTRGEAKNTYGTGCFLLLNTGAKRVTSSHGLITTPAFQLGRQAEVQYALEGSIAVGGVGVQWLEDNLGIIKSHKDSERVASSVPDTAGLSFQQTCVVLVPAFNGLLAPHWRDDARGVILGITSYTKAAHIVRAMLEAIAWQTREVLDAMRDDAGLGKVVLKVDGGASENDLLMQIQADALQLPVCRPEMLETTALGAAYAAGIGCGLWSVEWVLKGRDTSQENISIFEPRNDASRVEAMYRRWQRAVQRSFDLADFADEQLTI